ncbi:MAG TPA: hypothetical protein VKB67_05830 [Rhizomicrobium sp.]|nr:hypothetical protein [Rhizomicrobium sp.]
MTTHSQTSAHFQASAFSAERIGQYYKNSKEALDASIAARDYQVANGFLKLAIGWSDLASQVQGELDRQQTDI